MSVSYKDLQSLYFGETANADLAGQEVRELLHLSSPLDSHIPEWVNEGLDVVLTGNPGDGKSHIVRRLLDAKELVAEQVELDASTRSSEEVIARWVDQRRRDTPLVLCANEAPLRDMLEAMRSVSALGDAYADIDAQLRRLVVARAQDLPGEPRRTILVDLADRNILREQLIEEAYGRVCVKALMPKEHTSAQRNMGIFLESAEARRRMARLIALAGRSLSDHVSFRQLWATIAYSLCAGKAESTLRQELSVGKADNLDSYPIDQLVNPSRHVKLSLIHAVGRYADPALVPSPQLDEDLWTSGYPSAGRWLWDAQPLPCDTPSHLWKQGDQEGALARFGSLKRLIALIHSEGERLIDALTASQELAFPNGYADDKLLRDEIILGLRRLFLTEDQEQTAPQWICDGIPLWISNTYRDIPVERRPHVAVAVAQPSSFKVLRPIQPPWLQDVLGPRPEIAWLSHVPSGVSLRIDPPLLATLRHAAACRGPIHVPQVVRRFLSRLAGWDEGQQPPWPSADHMAVIDRPRGALAACGNVARQAEGKEASYVS